MPTKTTSKIGSRSVMPSAKGSSPAGNSGGNPGKSMSQKAIPGPASSGGPASLKKALTKKHVPGGDVTGAAGMVR